MTVSIINKAVFILGRYDNYRYKLRAFEEMGFNIVDEKMYHHIYMGDQNVGMMLNLDSKCEDIPEIELYKEMVICDGCNGHISESQFIQIDDNMTYHESCYGGDTKEARIKTTEEILETLKDQADNVVSMFRKKDSNNE
jgi:hypothetical protein